MKNNFKGLNLSDFTLVEFKELYGKLYPYCKKHGTMNKVHSFKEGGGIWRCISTYAVLDNTDNIIENNYRAGCEEEDEK